MLKSDGTLDLTAALETAKDLVKEPEWLNVTQTSLKVCSKQSDSYLATYQSYVKFTKDECNVKYEILLSCLDIFGFGVSFIRNF